MLEQQFGAAATWTEPTNVVEITDGTRLTLAGMEFDVLHAPGHTEGSVMFGIDRVPDGIREQVDVDRTMVTGDVLFAGSIGRTDLPGRRPGRDAAQPARRRAAAGRHDARAARALPGHDDGPRAGHQPLPERLAGVSTLPSPRQGRQGHPDQRLPGVPPVRAHRRAAVPRRHPGDVRAARVLLDRDPVHRADRAAQRAGRGRRQGDLRRVAAAPAAATTTRAGGCTST